ncbi:MAG: mechanosensitive ion channel domain-containing protein [Pirellula sp.]
MSRKTLCLTLLVTFCFFAKQFCNAIAVAPIATDGLNVASSEASIAEPVQETTSSESDSVEGAPEDGESEAEQIAELKESIENDRVQLQSLEIELDDPNGEYATAEKEFRSLDEARDLLAEQIESAIALPLELEAIESLQDELRSIEKRWSLAKDRFDLAIEDRKTTKEQRVTLSSKIERDEQALLELTEDLPEDEKRPSNSSTKDSKEKSNDESEEKKRDLESKEDIKGPSKGSTEEVDEKKGSSEDEPEAVDEELMEAEKEAELKETAAEEAQQETQSLEARLKDLQQLIHQEQKEITTAKKKVDLAASAQHELSSELSKREAEGADAQEIQELKKAISDANQRLIQSRSDVTQINERLSDHRAELSDLQAEHIVALHEAARKSREAQEAEELVESLKNPYTIRNILQWVMIHGPRLLLIVVGMFGLNRFASLFAYRSIQLVSKSAGRGSKAERENRAKTLVGVFQNAATVGIFITGFLMILEELGANITVLMGGVAVVGLAVAFGAQNLIKDYFYGFVMLLENQYMLNDTVRIGGLVGQVERITLRMTVLRDSSGVVHFVPNGTINSVSNETHGWSRATIEVGIGQQDDFEKIEALLVTVAQELKDDPVIGKLLLDTPTTPMLDSLGAPSIQLKMSVKTMPNKHGVVKQEWLRRVKRALSSNRSFESDSTQPHESEPHTLSYRPKDAA